MTRSVRTSKVTTVDYDLGDVRALLAENAGEALGPPEPGFERSVQMKTVFHVEKGDVIVTGFQLTIQDSASPERRRGVEESSLFLTRGRS